MRTPPFVWHGVTITDPTTDETGRFPVGPDYYEDHSVEAEIARSMSDQFLARYAPHLWKEIQKERIE